MWYDDDLISFLRRVEAALFKVVLLGILLLAGMEVLSGSGTMVVGIEGTSASGGVSLSHLSVGSEETSEGDEGEFGVLTIETFDGASLPYVKILVNHKPVGDLRYREVTFKVREGDLVEVDGRAHPDQVRLRVNFTSGHILWPREGMEITLSGESKKICEVVFRK